MQEIIIIAAMAENRVIGKNNLLPWSIKEDMVHFRELTKGSPCIMGRKTWESLPRKPLPGRLNIIVSGSSSVPKDELCPQERALSPKEPKVIIFPSLTSAIKHCVSYEKIFICGGETIYRQALAFANKIELTLIHREYEGDAFFPEIDTGCWKPVNTVNFDTFSFITYNKI
ncbi:MAG: dihydrofolate reductase [Treponema sp.]|jgi:dihydrofolate reductase|nr:dihydrofolate reductase [Treponema sp.]